VFVLPTDEIEVLAKQTFQEHNNASRENGDENNYEAEYIVSIHPEQHILRLQQSDIIIARGITALKIQQIVPNTPVSEIPISGSDVLSVILNSVKEHGKTTIGIANSANMVYSAKNIAEHLGANLKSYIIPNNDPDTIRESVQKAISDGCRVMIGGFDICDCARSFGIPSYPIPSSKESIWLAITEAKHNAQIRNQERIKALYYYGVLQNIQDAIIATDDKKNILAFNPSAERYLNIRQSDAIGAPLDSILYNNQMADIINDDVDYRNQLVDYENTIFVANKRRIFMDQIHCVGVLLTFQKVESLQKAETSIRKKLYRKGWVAKHTFADIVGKSKKIERLISTAKIYANAKTNLLIQGETGTGKELFAQSVHNASPRKDGPFVAVNCAALTPSLIESELFGYSRGSFTGALREGKSGVFENAHNGTLFLDEISEIPLNFQGRLLRVIQESEVIRVGDDCVLHVDVRIICASNRSLLKMVQNGEFREDLYYRLNVLHLEIPPLRERQEDIIPVFEYFLGLHIGRVFNITPEAHSFLRSLPWPGNVRQIHNMCERIAILNHHGTISLASLEEAILINPTSGKVQPHKKSNSDRDIAIVPKKRISDDLYALKSALERNNNNREVTAQELGISRTTLWRKMKTLGLSMDEE
jgi:transcriptional regulator with PAS, ATPase and Fis domain